MTFTYTVAMKTLSFEMSHGYDISISSWVFSCTRYLPCALFNHLNPEFTSAIVVHITGIMYTRQKICSVKMI